MSQRFDVSLKMIFLREGDGVLPRLLFGGRTVQALATEQPQVLNRRAELVMRALENVVVMATACSSPSIANAGESKELLLDVYGQGVGEKRKAGVFGGARLSQGSGPTHV